MTLQQIIVVDDDGSKITITSSEEPRNSEELINGKRHIRMGVNTPLSFVLKELVQEEWSKIKEFGARLVKRKARMK